MNEVSEGGPLGGSLSGTPLEVLRLLRTTGSTIEELRLILRVLRLTARRMREAQDASHGLTLWEAA